MCVNGRWITNKYTQDRFFVKCGHCKACLQEKAAKRSSRIRNEYSPDIDIIFGTLTYDRYSCPYIKQEDLDSKVDVLPVYRRYDWRWSVNRQKYVRSWTEPKLTEVVHPDYDCNRYCRWLEKQPHKIGVCYFKDFQDFAKRLRQNLKRDYGIQENIKLFDCSEYGESSQRPHFHFLLSIPKGHYDEARSSIIKSWSFGARIRDPKSVQLVTDDPAGYVSSYVNCSSKFPSFLARNFAPKSSYSKLYGHGRKSFQLDYIKSKIDSPDTGTTLTYDLLRTRKGVSEVVNLPIPKYVVNRFFPLFKGYSRLTSSEVYDLLSTGFEPSRFERIGRNYDMQNYNVKSKIEYNDDDIHKICVRLNHAFYYYQSVTGGNRFDFAIDYEKTWRLYRSTVYRLFMEDYTVPACYKYDNLCHRPNPDVDFVFRLGCSQDSQRLILNPNEFPQNINSTLRMSTYFDKYVKQKFVTNVALNANGVLI